MIKSVIVKQPVIFILVIALFILLAAFCGIFAVVALETTPSLKVSTVPSTNGTPTITINSTPCPTELSCDAIIAEQGTTNGSTIQARGSMMAGIFGLIATVFTIITAILLSYYTVQVTTEKTIGETIQKGVDKELQSIKDQIKKLEDKRDAVIKKLDEKAESTIKDLTNSIRVDKVLTDAEYSYVAKQKKELLNWLGKPHTSPNLDCHMQDIYIPLRLSTAENPVLTVNVDMKEQRTSKIQVDKLFTNTKLHILIVGEPHTGKTTLLWYIALLALRGDIEGLPRHAVRVDLSKFASSDAIIGSGILDGSTLIDFVLRDGYGISAGDLATAREQFKDRIESGEIFFILDKLDEAATRRDENDVTLERYNRVIKAINEFAEDCKNAKIIVAARSESYHYYARQDKPIALTNFSKWRLDVLQEKDIVVYIDKLINALPGKNKETAKEAQKLFYYKPMRDLVTDFHVLHDLIAKHINGRPSLSMGNCQSSFLHKLYGECATQLLVEADAFNVKYYQKSTPDNRKKILNKLAAFLYVNRVDTFSYDWKGELTISVIESGATSPNKTVREELQKATEKFLKDFKDSEEEQQCLRDAVAESGILRYVKGSLPDEPQYRFASITWQQYFASMYYIDEYDVTNVLPMPLDIENARVLVLHFVFYKIWKQIHPSPETLSALIDFTEKRSGSATSADDAYYTRLRHVASVFTHCKETRENLSSLYTDIEKSLLAKIPASPLYAQEQIVRLLNEVGKFTVEESEVTLPVLVPPLNDRLPVLLFALLSQKGLSEEQKQEIRNVFDGQEEHVVNSKIQTLLSQPSPPDVYKSLVSMLGASGNHTFIKPLLSILQKSSDVKLRCRFIDALALLIEQNHKPEDTKEVLNMFKSLLRQRNLDWHIRCHILCVLHRFLFLMDEEGILIVRDQFLQSIERLKDNEPNEIFVILYSAYVLKSLNALSNEEGKKIEDNTAQSQPTGSSLLVDEILHKIKAAKAEDLWSLNKELAEKLKANFTEYLSKNNVIVEQQVQVLDLCARFGTSEHDQLLKAMEANSGLSEYTYRARWLIDQRSKGG